MCVCVWVVSCVHGMCVWMVCVCVHGVCVWMVCVCVHGVCVCVHGECKGRSDGASHAIFQHTDGRTVWHTQAESEFLFWTAIE